VVKVLAGDGHSYWTKGFAEADDVAEADGDKILSFFQAQDRTKELARGDDAEAAPVTAPITVDRALTDYAADLRARNADPYNARRSRRYLTPPC
jgi:uncharacterized Ntn-hydrolase superfamily protein